MLVYIRGEYDLAVEYDSAKAIDWQLSWYVGYISALRTADSMLNVCSGHVVFGRPAGIRYINLKSASLRVAVQLDHGKASKFENISTAR